MPRERRVGSTPTSPTSHGGRRWPASTPRRAVRRRPPSARYTSRAMTVTATPAPQSTVELEIELPPGAPRPGHRRRRPRTSSRRTRVPGFRPGKAPRPVLERSLGPGAVLDEAVEHLVQDAYREALVEQEILPLTNADVEVVQAEEGKPLIFKATVPVRPEVKLGDYRNFNFRPRSRPSTTPRSTRSSRSCATRTRPWRRSRTAAPRTATTPSSRSRGRATASRSRAARPSGCR